MKTRFPLLALATALVLCGCTSVIQVQTDSNAKVRYRGLGRAAFRWKDAPNLGSTAIPVRYGRVKLYAIWPDGVRSEPVEVTLSNWHEPEPVTLTRPADPLPATSEK